MEKNGKRNNERIEKIFKQAASQLQDEGCRVVIMLIADGEQHGLLGHLYHTDAAVIGSMTTTYLSTVLETIEQVAGKQATQHFFDLVLQKVQEKTGFHACNGAEDTNPDFIDVPMVSRAVH